MGERYTNQIDSVAVDEHRMRVSGQVGIDHATARQLAYDNEVLIVMLAKAAPPNFSQTKDGDVIRLDILKPIEVHAVKEYKARQKIMSDLAFDHEAQPSFPFPDASSSESGPASSPITLLNVQDEEEEHPMVGEAVSYGVKIPGELRGKLVEGAKHLFDGDPDTEVTVTGGFNSATGIDHTVIGPGPSGTDDVLGEPGEEEPEEAPPVDDTPIEEDFVVEGEPEPEISDEDEDAFFAEFFGMDTGTKPVRYDEPDPTAAPGEPARVGGKIRGKIGGQAERDSRLSEFLEAVAP